MEKAINRQRVLLAHLEPAASPAAAAPAITVSPPTAAFRPGVSRSARRADVFDCWFWFGWCRRARAPRGTAPRTTAGRASQTTSSSSRK